MDLDRGVSICGAEYSISMDHETPVRYANQLPQRRLWFGTAAGAAAWALHGFTCFVISADLCQTGGVVGSLGTTGLRILLAAITAVALAVAIAGGVISFRNWRAVENHAGITHAEAPNREAFMALVGVFLSTVFVVGIIWAGIPLIVVNVCTSAR